MVIDESFGVRITDIVNQSKKNESFFKVSIKRRIARYGKGCIDSR